MNAEKKLPNNELKISGRIGDTLSAAVSEAVVTSGACALTDWDRVAGIHGGTASAANYSSGVYWGSIYTDTSPMLDVVANELVSSNFAYGAVISDSWPINGYQMPSLGRQTSGSIRVDSLSVSPESAMRSPAVVTALGGAGLSSPSAVGVVDENILNAERKKHFFDKYVPMIRCAIRDEPFEAGVLARGDYLLQEMLSQNGAVAMQCMQELFISSLARSDMEVACGVMDLVGRLEKPQAGGLGMTMAIAAIAIKHVPLQEAGIRALESWPSQDTISVLRQIDFASEWLRRYAKRVAEVMAAAV